MKRYAPVSATSHGSTPVSIRIVCVPEAVSRGDGLTGFSVGREHVRIDERVDRFTDDGIAELKSAWCDFRSGIHWIDLELKSAGITIDHVSSDKEYATLRGRNVRRGILF